MPPVSSSSTIIHHCIFLLSSLYILTLSSLAEYLEVISSALETQGGAACVASVRAGMEGLVALLETSNGPQRVSEMFKLVELLYHEYSGQMPFKRGLSHLSSTGFLSKLASLDWLKNIPVQIDHDLIKMVLLRIFKLFNIDLNLILQIIISAIAKLLL